jgi:S-DNA-T family DNA segregation ATPase FtsK/SpoIIIE
LSSGYVCPECGLDYDTVSKADAAVAVRSFPRRFAEQLHRSDGDEPLLRRRPEPSVWSPLEYTAHVRDGFAWMADTVRRMVTETNPVIDFFDPDELAERDGYNGQAVHDVLAALDANAHRFADVIDDVSTDDLGRMAQFSWGDRDVLMMIRNGVHEGKHHLRDVELVLERLGVPRRD